MARNQQLFDNSLLLLHESLLLHDKSLLLLFQSCTGSPIK
jgi:hypothetical protein